MKQLSVYPKVQKIEIKEAPYHFSDKPQFKCESCKDILYKTIRNWCERNNYRLIENHQENEDSKAAKLILKQTKVEKITYIEEIKSVTNEKYSLDISINNAQPEIRIKYSHRRGLLYALTTLNQMINADELYQCCIEDFPKFNIRGIIEGYYGKPWKEKERNEILSLMAQYKMNTYFYGPKDDPYHRKLWRTPYDSKSLSKLKKLFNHTKDLEIDFYYSIGPGLSIRYSDENDFELLFRKLKQIYSIGVTRFGFFLDDIPPLLQYKEDREAFEDLVSAHIAIISKLFDYLKRLDSKIKLAICPTQYHGRGNEHYISRLGQNLDPLIDIFWTGPEICSRELTLHDAGIFTTATYHKPLYWDNYPVNDLEMSTEMHIGPYINRDCHLYRFSRGIISNGMEYAEASKIPFITISCYLWNPEQYNSENCWQHAINRIVGEKDSSDFLVFADNVRYSALYPADSPNLENIISKFMFEYLYGNSDVQFLMFDRAIAPYIRAAEHLSKNLQNKKLGAELKPWLSKFAAGIKLLVKTVNYLKNCNKKDIDALKKLYKNYQADNTKVFADVLYPVVKAVIEGDYCRKKPVNIQ